MRRLVSKAGQTVIIVTAITRRLQAAEEFYTLALSGEEDNAPDADETEEADEEKTRAAPAQ